ncbi:MAG: LysM peptidoglycan-binding domain-containing protein [Leptospiraceae bacterium]|nr:LysM peptidoglycan-binding domain-containing protein [Leptospiraceae bacterium]
MKKITGLIFFITYFCFALYAVDFIEYKVVSGDTLSKISKEYLSNPQSWRELLKYNHIDSPNKISPGLVLKIPDYLSKKKITAKPVAIARIGTKLGTVKYKKETELEWTDGKKGQLLEADLVIRTLERSTAEIEFFDDPEVLIQVRENSIMKVKMDKVRGIELAAGETFVKFLSHSAKDTKDIKFQLVTPTSVAGVRGTEFNVSTDLDGLDKYACNQGLIQVSAQGETVEVPAGFGTTVKKGEAPQKPFKLLDKVILKPMKVKIVEE